MLSPDEFSGLVSSLTVSLNIIHSLQYCYEHCYDQDKKKASEYQKS